MSDMTTDTIIEQFGGGRAFFMVGAKRILRDTSKGAIIFQFMPTCRTKARWCEIKYDAGRDSYIMTFFKMSPKWINYADSFTKKPRRIKVGEERVTIETREDVYCDELQAVFEDYTGIYTHL